MVFNNKAVIAGIILFVASLLLLLSSVIYYINRVPKTNIGVTLGVSENTYQPPMDCYLSLRVAGAPSLIYMNVHGINSTVFCRRVVSDFTFGKAEIVLEPSPLKSACVIEGEGFSISLSSLSDKTAQYMCRMLRPNSVNAYENLGWSRI